MAFGDAAKEALKKAFEVYEDLAKVKAVVSQIEARITDFRDETRKRLTDFEARIDNRATNIEERSDKKIDRLEERNRQLESRLATLEGDVRGALAEAYAAWLRNRPDGAQPGGAGDHLLAPKKNSDGTM
jgi:chromosome segregation ATPase